MPPHLRGCCRAVQTKTTALKRRWFLEQLTRLDQQIEHRLACAAFIAFADGVGHFGMVSRACHRHRFLPVGHPDRDPKGNVDGVSHIVKQAVAAGFQNRDVKFDVGIEGIILTPFGGAHPLKRNEYPGDIGFVTPYRRQRSGSWFNRNPKIVEFANKLKPAAPPVEKPAEHVGVA